MQLTGHPHFTGDVQNIHDLQLMYGMYVTNGRHMEHSRFMVDVQDGQNMKNQQSTDQKLPKCDSK